LPKTGVFGLPFGEKHHIIVGLFSLQLYDTLTDGQTDSPGYITALSRDDT